VLCSVLLALLGAQNVACWHQIGDADRVSRPGLRTFRLASVVLLVSDVDNHSLALIHKAILVPVGARAYVSEHCKSGSTEAWLRRTLPGPSG